MSAYVVEVFGNVLSKYVMGYIDFNWKHMWSLIIKQWISFLRSVWWISMNIVFLNLMKCPRPISQDLITYLKATSALEGSLRPTASSWC